MSVRFASDRTSFFCSRRTSRSRALMRSAASGVGVSDTVVSVGDQQGHEALVMVLRAGRISHVRADLSVPVKATDRHDLAEYVAYQPDLLLGAGAEQDLARGAGEEQRGGGLRSRREIGLGDGERLAAAGQNFVTGRQRQTHARP